ncbi:hypothetical protein KZP23_17945 [Echinicola marina]|uniref:hypothetical protein n=1 Tax=Echinicola marina TaxID=2859768 RepID=UPI001CF693D9|nr:hypothetical protein [Echinicola marina]UCS92555.1 hypothetical protein KZP23_17945 [Echinicola marina]
MGLKFLRIDDPEPLNLDKVRFLPGKNKFLLSSSQDPGNEFYCDFCFEKNPSYSHLRDSQFDVYLFHNSAFAANDIYQISDSKSRTEANRGRLGYLIPIQSLINAEHDYGDNEHFSPYAYHAIRILLSDKNALPYKRLGIPNSVFIDLEAIYGENTHVLILHKPYVTIWEKVHAIKFEIKYFLPCLWSYGYMSIEESNFNVLYKDKEHGNGAEKPINGIIEFTSIAPDLRTDPFILNLFTSFLYSQKHELIRFHLLYQVIELLIEKVFQSELGSIIQDFDNNVNNFYDIKEKLTIVANEKSRITKLFSNYCIGQNALLEALKISCNKLLKQVNPEYEQSSPQIAVYKTRSLVFHSFRSLPTEYDENLKVINDDFEALIIATINSFKYPENSN